MNTPIKRKCRRLYAVMLKAHVRGGLFGRYAGRLARVQLCWALAEYWGTDTWFFHSKGWDLDEWVP